MLAARALPPGTDRPCPPFYKDAATASQDSYSFDSSIPLDLLTLTVGELTPVVSIRFNSSLVLKVSIDSYLRLIDRLGYSSGSLVIPALL